MPFDIIKAIVSALGAVISPVSVNSAWTIIRPAGTIDTADSGTITVPRTQITEARCKNLDCSSGTHVMVRVAAPVATTSGSVTVAFYGTTSDSDVEQLLYTRGGAATLTLTIDGNSINDGTTVVSTVASANLVDRMGCKNIRIAVLSAFSGANPATAWIEAKVI